ncbi:MAG: 6,7-dimethyl-8-ribityllumazine synthase [Candidatus Omnitrophica bacterium]|nr:6,7-dimethyl-8-ribityllumazine synthase [Candidatus Omnitrophota bacterium]
MPEAIEAKMEARGRSFAIVVSRFNEYITQHLLEGAIKELSQYGVRDSDIAVTWVPGAFEIPLTVLNLAETRRYSAVIALGAIIRGSTPHFEYLSQAVSRGLAEVQVRTQTPVAFGVITTDTLEQAIERAGTKHGNKGREAARVAIEMAGLAEAIKAGGASSPSTPLKADGERSRTTSRTA